MGDIADPLRVINARGEDASVLRGLWAPNPAFLVCGGPSLQDVNLERLRERGVVSLGINQAAAWAPVRAWAYSDPNCKFHHGLFLDPSVMTFTPNWKLHHHVMMKLPGQGFRLSSILVGQCPSTFGFDRRTMFVPERFFEDPWAHWGPGKHQPPDRSFLGGCLCTMLLGIRLLHWLGVKTIYLIGVDHKGRDGKCYGFPCEKRERSRRYKREQAMLEALKPVFQEHGVSVYNCSPHSECKLFPYCLFDEAIEHCKGDVPDEPLDLLGWYCKREMWAEAKQYSEYTPKHFRPSTHVC